MLRSPLLFQDGVVCNQIMEYLEKVCGKAAAREAKKEGIKEGAKTSH